MVGEDGDGILEVKIDMNQGHCILIAINTKDELKTGILHGMLRQLGVI